MTERANSIQQVIESGLCIGCGLCEAVGAGSVRMTMTERGSLRPRGLDSLDESLHQLLLDICPGVYVEPRSEDDPAPHRQHDPIWGDYYRIQLTWSGDRDIRFRAATGGTLTALGIHLLNRGKVDYILHVGADPERPMRSRWSMSTTAEDVIQNSISRYGPTSPLSGFMTALDLGKPFALIAKPCDLNAIANLARQDPRVDKLCLYRMCMVCGGQSRLTKSREILDDLGLDEDELTLFRYRGYGNPGSIRLETRDGRAFERSYMSFWEDESKWDVETRCKFCPDALGEAADIAAADYWPGGNPVGEDAGFNFVISHTKAGEALLDEAFADGELVGGDHLNIDQINDAQPHQVRKKQAMAARLQGLADVGLAALVAHNYRLDDLDEQIGEAQRQRQREGVAARVQQGRIKETVPE
jgi:coenzyme F420 hydrogenase subunit beta